jgi:Fe-Mn family superoxide dismutase
MFHLPPLPYAENALEPYLDQQTMHIHHQKHHATYVDRLNTIVDEHGLDGRDLQDLLENIDSLPEKVQMTIRNHGGGHHNHSLFWLSLSPQPSGPDLELSSAIDKDFGSLDELIEKMQAVGATVFGSGWVWLLADGKQLTIKTTANQDSPLMYGLTPLLGIDVWEHAYYLKYQNKRATYLENIFKVVDWDTVSERYANI